MEEFDDPDRLSNAVVALRLVGFFLFFAAFVYLVPLFYGRPIGSYVNEAQARRDFVEMGILPTLQGQPLYAAVGRVEGQTMLDLRDKLAAMRIETDVEGAQRALDDFGKNLLAVRASEFGRAAHEDIANFRLAELGMMQIMQAESPQACGNYALGGLGLDPRMSVGAYDAYSDMLASMLTAAKRGRDAPAARQPTAPSAADYAALQAAMQAQGVGPAAFAIYASPDAMAAASPEVRCELSIRAALAVERLPEAVADRIVIADVQSRAGLKR